MNIAQSDGGFMAQGVVPTQSSHGVDFQPLALERVNSREWQRNYMADAFCQFGIIHYGNSCYFWNCLLYD